MLLLKLYPCTLIFKEGHHVPCLYWFSGCWNRATESDIDFVEYPSLGESTRLSPFVFGCLSLAKECIIKLIDLFLKFPHREKSIWGLWNLLWVQKPILKRWQVFLLACIRNSLSVTLRFSSDTILCCLWISLIKWTKNLYVPSVANKNTYSCNNLEKPLSLKCVVWMLRPRCCLISHLWKDLLL